MIDITELAALVYAMDEMDYESPREMFKRVMELSELFYEMTLESDQVVGD